eukprot:CAMPEP_0195570790 /NCGR_PEP_ID=MMETSP0814-20130614/3686_1 /TAXON_ID=97485 /ORGANISM="Prymnesium parvum, Strain Texoma1" /LENGTH=134 /DNA_ID=CAMNT_0040706339 /DNA_START=149 /DNA_END=554 /DNA_ORIENTATION=+
MTEDAAIAINQRPSCARNLPSPRHPIQLCAGLDDIIHGRHLPRSPKCQEPSMSVDGEVSRRVCRRGTLMHLFHPRSSASAWSDATRLERSHEADGEAVVQSEQVDILRQEFASEKADAAACSHENMASSITGGG